MGDPVPIGEALNGLTTEPLEAGTVAVSGIAIVEAMNPDGEHQWVLRTLGEVGTVPLIGALTVLLDHERRAFAEVWTPDEE